MSLCGTVPSEGHGRKHSISLVQHNITDDDRSTAVTDAVSATSPSISSSPRARDPARVPGRPMPTIIVTGVAAPT